ncbi:hypothetical protein [Streptomyces sp. NPDC046821]|uniref:hypothetical protein n=1 Tax=Streptomyces sp. NPDC046821 TaxID=3154702 RepID=UPI003401E3A1
MTTTGSPDERAEPPQPGGADGALAEPQPDGADGALADPQRGGADGGLAEPAAQPAGQSGDLGGGQSAVAPRPPRNSDADEGDGRPRESFASIVGETLGLAPGSSRRRRVVTLLVMLSIAFVAVFRDTLTDYLMIKPSVARENDSNTEYDADKVPFTVSVRPVEDEPETWSMVLDRTLTPDEMRKLVDLGERAASFSYLKKLGGRPLADEATLEDAPERYKEQLSSRTIGRFSDAFLMNVMSTRSTSVVINRWKVTDVACRKSTGRTVVMLPEQGGASYEGIQLHIPPFAGEPVLADETKGQGQSYFGTHVIEVGGGQPSGSFKVQAIAPRGKSCTWGIKLRYTDSYQTTRWVQLKDGKGKPLRIRTESVPMDAQQWWVFIVDPWRLCEQSKSHRCVIKSGERAEGSAGAPGQ